MRSTSSLRSCQPFVYHTKMGEPHEHYKIIDTRCVWNTRSLLDHRSRKLKSMVMANLRRMHHLWRIAPFWWQATSTHSFFFALHQYFSVENRKSEGVKTFFIFCSPPTLSVENRTSEGISARRGATIPCPSPPLWPCDKVLKPNFQSVISQTTSWLVVVASFHLF